MIEEQWRNKYKVVIERSGERSAHITVCKNINKPSVRHPGLPKELPNFGVCQSQYITVLFKKNLNKKIDKTICKIIEEWDKEDDPFHKEVIYVE